MSSNTTEGVVEASDPVKACNDRGLNVYLVEVDTDHGIVPAGIHIVAPNREQAENKLAVAFRRLGCRNKAIPDVHLVEV